MRARIIRIISVITVLSVMCLLLSSCGEKKKPAYVLVAGEDTGIVSSYEAYFELNGSSVKEVKEVRYDNLIMKSSDYSLINQKLYHFSVTSNSSNPSNFVYTQSGYDKETYDNATLIKQLKKMGIFWTGSIQIIIYEFEGYTIVEAQHLDGNTLLETETGLFRNGRLINLPQEISLKSISKVYKKTK